MNVLFLNHTYTKACETLGIKLTTLTDYTVLDKHFAYVDVRTIMMESLALTKLVPFSNMEMNVISSGDELPVDNTSFLINPVDNELMSVAAEIYADKKLMSCVAANSNTLVFYVKSESAQPELDVIDTMLGALSQIMTVDAVMQSKAFQYFVKH